jgi:hypothetical protein
VSDSSRKLIRQGRREVDTRLERLSASIHQFFENELTSGTWGLYRAARDHLDRFRSFLHSYYIEQHGFWPPKRFDDEVVQRNVCNSLYSDFKSLYHHLADEKSSHSDIESDLNNTGGVCVLQNIRSFDSRLHNDPLPTLLPRLPCETKVETTRNRNDRRESWNPFAQRKMEKKERNARRAQALIDSTNRDWSLMSCLLVRRFSEFEASTAIDDLETVSLADGRKVRWLAVYAILQVLISAMQAPQKVRNTEGLSYPLCCRIPDTMPWGPSKVDDSATEIKPAIEPDATYSHTNLEPNRPILSRRNSVVPDSPERSDSDSPGRSITRSASALRPASMIRRLSNKSDTSAKEPRKRQGSFTEIYVPGYGNGLNQVEISSSPVDDTVPRLSSSASVSRESSNASSNSTWSKTTTDSGSTLSARTPDSRASDIASAMAELGLAIAKTDSSASMHGAIQIIPAEEGLETVHFNARTWTDVIRLA